MRNFYSAALFVIAVIAFSSCKKESGGGGTTNHATEVTMTFPTANQIAVNGTNLLIDGTVTDMNIIANVNVQIRNKMTGAVLYSSQVTTASVTFFRYTFNWQVTGITTPTGATVKVTGRDINGGEGFKEVDVILEP